MNLFQELSDDKNLQSDLISFFKKYGKSGLKEAIKIYTDIQKEYICKTRKSITKLKIGEIYYLEIKQHTIFIHTCNDIYQKYGTLNKELEFLSSYGFVKCNQSCIVALNKIKIISNNDIILTDNTKIHISRIYAPKVLMAFFHSQSK